jgi:leader peptidase (prepilin peptidase)/N-methyltransferase
VIEALLALLFGLLIGSFLNVCIHRMPRDISVVRPRSYCPTCEHQIAWHDNIPLASYLLLRGKCRYCGASIPARYPIVELLTAALFFAAVLKLGVTLPAIKICLFGALLVGLIFSDLEERILPDEFTLGGTAAGLILAWFIPVDDFTGRMLIVAAGLHLGPHWESVAEAAVGAVIPSTILWMGGWAFEKIRHKEGLGLGDVKMLAMIGAFLGVRGSLLALVAGSLLGSVIGLGYILVTRKDASTYELPFGTFLGIAGIGVAALGPAFWNRLS